MTITATTSVGTDVPVTEQQVITKIAWRIMPLIIVCYLFAFFDRVNISFAKTQLQHDLGLSNTAYGFGASLFVVGYVLLEVPSNMLLYRFGARRWIARIMISWGLATAAMVFVNSEWQLVAQLVGDTAKDDLSAMLRVFVLTHFRQRFGLLASEVPAPSVAEDGVPYRMTEKRQIH